MLRKIVNFVLGILLITAVIIAPIVVAGNMDTHYKINGIVKIVNLFKKRRKKWNYFNYQKY